MVCEFKVFWLVVVLRSRGRNVGGWSQVGLSSSLTKESELKMSCNGEWRIQRRKDQHKQATRIRDCWMILLIEKQRRTRRETKKIKKDPTKEWSGKVAFVFLIIV